MWESSHVGMWDEHVTPNQREIIRFVYILSSATGISSWTSQKMAISTLLSSGSGSDLIPVQTQNSVALPRSTYPHATCTVTHPEQSVPRSQIAIAERRGYQSSMESVFAGSSISDSNITVNINYNYSNPPKRRWIINFSWQSVLSDVIRSCFDWTVTIIHPAYQIMYCFQIE